MEDARALENAGCYSLVLECVPAEVAEAVSRSLSIPTIGIGAGAGCGGQVLVCYDLLGFNPDFSPKFLKKFLDGHATLKAATEAYVGEVRAGAFPSDEHSFHQHRSGRVREVPGGLAVRVLDGERQDEDADKPDRLYG